MQFINRIEAAKQLKVGINTVTGWAKQNRIRTSGWVKNQPIFTQAAIDEVKPEVEKYGRPSVKTEEDVEPVPA